MRNCAIGRKPKFVQAENNSTLRSRVHHEISHKKAITDHGSIWKLSNYREAIRLQQVVL